MDASFASAKILLFYELMKKNTGNRSIKLFFIDIACHISIFFLSLACKTLLFNHINTYYIMANKRSLKRNINYVCSELFSEVVAISYTTDASDEDIKALLTSILVIHNDYVRRVSHVEPGLAPRLFFKSLITNFNKQASEIVDQISNLG